MPNFEPSIRPRKAGIYHLLANITLSRDIWPTHPKKQKPELLELCVSFIFNKETFQPQGLEMLYL